MAERMGTHPDSAELQKYADGEVQDKRVALHVESCATCREEVAAVRRVTAALSLGSKAPDSLAARIQERRVVGGRVTPPAPFRRSRIRVFMLPVGLAAAAALAVFVPRALRETPRDVDPSALGAKGAIPADAVVFETVLSEWSASSLDSVLRALGSPGTAVELRYVTDRDESVQAQRLADGIARFLREEGVEESGITVRRELAQAHLRPLPAGAVGITVRSRPSSSPP